MMPPSIFSRCKRGVFGLNSWETQRKPGSESKSEPKTETQQNGASQPRQTGRIVPNNKPVQPPNAAAAEMKPLVAKYSYQANPNSPLGVELTIKQGDKLALCSDAHDLWWEVKDTNGDIGYVPASYVMVGESEPSGGLPWLQNKEPAPVVKGVIGGAAPYQSAYNRPTVDEKKYHCDICDKTLNGPKPYSAHMNSRAHREEEEYQREIGQL